jgi:hypothetical protein
LLVDVKLVGEVGHGNSLCDTPPPPFAIKLPCYLDWGCAEGHTGWGRAASTEKGLARCGIGTGTALVTTIAITDPALSHYR